MKTQNQVAFLKWLASEHPVMYKRAMSGMPRDVTLGRLGWINFLIQAVATVGSAVLGKKQVDKQVALQKKQLALTDAQATADREAAIKMQLLEVNTKRAQAGLLPVDATGKIINTAALPTPKSLLPFAWGQAQAQPSATIIPGVPDIATYIGGGLGVLALLRFLKVF